MINKILNSFDQINIQRLDHIGIVVKNIPTALETYKENLSLNDFTEIFEDPIQGVRVVFISIQNSSRIELIEAIDGESKIIQFSDNGGGLHHICFEVPNLSATLQRTRAMGAVTVCEPVPAVAFQNRNIAFIYTREKQLIEFVET